MKKDKYYYKDGSVLDHYNDNKILHREDGPAIEYASGSKHWYINDKFHREDGPAVELANGGKQWYINGKRHREDGPAIERADGSKHWYMNDIEYTEEDFKAELKAVDSTSDIEKIASPKRYTQEEPFDKIKKLAELHFMGILTDEEFATTKAKLLASI